MLDVEVELVRSLKISTLPIFEEGVEQYCQGNIANTQVGFEQIVALNPHDQPANFTENASNRC